MTTNYNIYDFFYNDYMPTLTKINIKTCKFIKAIGDNLDNINIYINNRIPQSEQHEIFIKNSHKDNKNINMYLYNIAKNLKIDIFGSNINFFCFTKKKFNANFLLYKNSDILIGEDSTCNGLQAISHNSNLYIKRDTMFSHNIVIQTDDQHKIIDLKTNKIINYDENKKNYVIINDHVWIGKNTFIKKNIEIGIGSIIGAGSVVTKNIDNFTCVAGIPAKQIKKDVSWIRNNEITNNEYKLFSKYQIENNFL